MNGPNRKTRFFRLKKQIFDNLTKRGMNDSIHREKAEEYLFFWNMAEDMRENIKEYGTNIFDEKRKMTVENRSVSLLIQASKQMQDIYKTLGLDEPLPEGGTDEL